MNKNHISIDEAHLEQTIFLCQKEQEQNIRQTNPSLMQLILRFMWLDFRFYMLLSILGLMISLFLIQLDTANALIYTTIYFFTLGITALYEYYKNRHYQMYEIVSPVYLNPCRSFMIRTAAIALNALCMSILLLPVFIWNTSIPAAEFIVTSIIPLYIMQLIFTRLLHKIKGYVSAVVLYALFYGVYLLLYLQFLRAMITSSIVLLSILLVSGIYLINMWRLNMELTDTERRQQKWSCL